MRRKRMRREGFRKILSLCLVLALLCSTLLLLLANAPSNILYASGVGVTAVSLTISDRRADPDTSRDMGFVDVPRVHDGRIWTDKSVGVGADSDDFSVTLSALSQSFPITAGFAIPADTVFVIDVSGSMADTDPGAGASRISLLIDALNEAIGILLDANPQNRIAVVAYGGASGGSARVENVLPLGRYTAEGGNFFTFRAAASPFYFGVNVGANPRNILVQGSTPTQWGIREGARVLEAASPTTAVVPITDDSGNVTGNVTVTRRPNIILMTDGEPTMGRPDFDFDSPAPVSVGPVAPGSGLNQLTAATGVFYGDGSYGELGLAVMTVLTAAYRQLTVQEQYFPGGAVTGQSGQPGASVGFYTISVGVQPGGPDGAAQQLITATMNPTPATTAVIEQGIRHRMDPGNWTSTITVGPTGDTPTMAQLLDAFAGPGGATGAFTAQFRQAFPNYQWDNPLSTVDIQNLAVNPLLAADLAYADLFFQATNLDSLREAFRSITTSIQQQSTQTVTNVDTSPDFDGWLVFSDVLGEYMEFRDGLELLFDGDGAPFYRDGFDLTIPALRSAYEGILLEHMNYGTPGAMSAAQVNALVTASINAGYTTSVRYFADFNRNFAGNYGTSVPAGAAAVVEVFPMFGTLSAPVVSGGQTNLMYITFHVVTALQDGTFTEIFTSASGAQVPMNRTLAAGDQLVRWYIPASLIPMRTVDSVTGAVSGNTSPIRVSFVVGLDQTRVLAELSAAYRSANAGPDGSIFFYTNRWRGNQNVTLAFDKPHPNNPFYQSGRPGFGDGRGTVIKEANPTETAPHVSFDRSFLYEGDRVDLHWMGNNGRLTVRLPGRLMITKAFVFDEVSGLEVPEDAVFAEPISFTIVVPDGADITMRFPDDFEWVAARGRYELLLPLELLPGTYTVIKSGGVLADDSYVYLPQPGVGTVTIVAEETATMEFVNEYFSRLPEAELPALRVRKIFHGLDDTEPPADFQIVIAGPAALPTGPIRPNDDPGWILNPVTNRYEITLSLEEAMTGTALRELAVGEYRVREVNHRIDGFDLIRVSWMVRELGDRFVMWGGEAETVPVPLFAVTIEAGDDVVARIDNFYEPADPPPPPSPSPPPPSPSPPPPSPSPPPPSPSPSPPPPSPSPSPPSPRPSPSPPPTPVFTDSGKAPATGDDRPVSGAIVLLAIGMSCMGGAGVYWLRKKMF